MNLRNEAACLYLGQHHIFPRERSSILRFLEAVEVAIGELIKSHPEFLRLCQWFRWGKIEIVVKDGKPVMISVRRDIKLD